MEQNRECRNRPTKSVQWRKEHFSNISARVSEHPRTEK